MGPSHVGDLAQEFAICAPGARVRVRERERERESDMGLTEPSDSEALTPSGHGSDEASEVRSSASSTLMFAPWQSAVDEGFWHRMASFKLETQRLDEHPVPVSGQDSVPPSPILTMFLNRFLVFLNRRFPTSSLSDPSDC